MINSEIPFSFLRDYHGGDINQKSDRAVANRHLRANKIPIDMTGLDLCISLWTLPKSQRNFEGILEDMRITTLGDVGPMPLPGESKISIEEAKIKRLQLTLDFLSKQKIISLNKNRYALTKKGIDIMTKAREALSLVIGK